MSNTARKARKRQLIAIRSTAEPTDFATKVTQARLFFRHPTKVGTPLAERSVPWNMRERNGQMQHLPGSRAVKRLRRRAEVTGEAL